MLAKKRIKIVNRPKAPKTSKQLERHLKGVANHRRIDILEIIAISKGINVEDVAEKLHCNIKTISVHIQRLVQAGLVRKNYKGRTVVHDLTPYGKTIENFIRTFQHS
jgi:DNA-binding MarR family transcriptional regulator